ncbi:hypothetical protein BD626DRAFT_513819 [Schizophyllum amplum]|uniref:Uncharacterized protein n=1 Tax=Schizophyllum amplum TaxID=97359 RepID=A0A550BYU3_9AGAR|nr:hypothetical protein BD626DRAFT_513819 [Auriculariopsis ampla]
MPLCVQRSVAHLTHLALYYMDHAVLREGLLDMLNRSPCLEYLLIVEPSENATAHVPSASVGADRRIILPHLRRLYLHDVWMYEAGIFRLLSSIDVPGDCDFRVKSSQSYSYTDPRISYLPSPADFHLLQRIDRVIVEISAQGTEDERRRHSCMAVRSGTLFVTLDYSLDNLKLPSWIVSDAHFVFIVLARLRSRSTLIAYILHQRPQLRTLDIVDEGQNTTTICHALQEYNFKPHDAAARLGVCHELREIKWYTKGPADEIWEMAQRRLRCGSPLQEVQVRMEAISDDVSGVQVGETSVHRLTAGERVGSFETRVVPETEWGLSAKEIIRMHTEAVTPCLPEGSEWDGEWMWDRKTRPRV